MKQIIRLTEEDIHRIVKESVNRVLNEVEIDNINKIPYHNDKEILRDIFKYAYKYAFNINKRYEIVFERDNRDWDKIYGGGATYKLYYREGDRGQKRSLIGWFTIKEINCDDFRDYQWLRNLSKTDGNEKIVMGATINGRNGNWNIIIDKDQLKGYIKRVIDELDAYTHSLRNYWNDNGYYVIFNDNILNSLANNIY